MRTHLFVFALFAAAAAGGCESTDTLGPGAGAWPSAPVSASAWPASALPVAATAPYAAPPSSSYVPYGVHYSVRLDQPIGCDLSVYGQTFTARVAAPLLDVAGKLAVPLGAKLYGRVVGVERGASPKLMVSFVAIDTVGGAVPIATAVAPDAFNPYLTSRAVDPTRAGYDSVLLPALPFARSMLEAGGGSLSPRFDPTHTVSVPRDAVVEMLLTAPLVVPPLRLREIGAPAARN